MTMKHPQTCLSAELLRRLSQDELSPAQLEEIEEHVSGCDRCRNLLEGAQPDTQWLHEIVPILRTPLESPHVAGDHDASGGDGESLESILRLLGPTDDPHMLGRVGSYEVVGVIGRGGMGVVFKAFEPALNRFVAIKMLLPQLAATGAARKRFAREGQAAAAVIDDHVLPIYCVAEWQGVPYLVTQYSRGATLQKRLQDQGPLELKEILRIGMQTARGLAAAHAQGLVHRDVKPSNILLDGTVERALLTDFGLARAVDDASITRTGIIAGTPQYMSPEQARGGSVDARSDLFSLGCVLYAMCSGRPPFRADHSHAILRMITDDEPRSILEINPDIPEWLCTLISRLMAKSPEARFERALDVADVLEQCLAHVQRPSAVALPSLLSPPRAVTVTRRHRTFFVGVLVMIASLALGLVAMFAWQQLSPPETSEQTAGDERGGVASRETDGPRAHEPGSTNVLQGTWAFVSIEARRPDGKRTMRKFDSANERIAFEGRKLIQKTMGDDGRVRKSSEFDITLDTKATPHRLTLQTTRRDRLSIRYIFEVKGDTLRMCFFALGEEDGKEVVAWPVKFSIDKDIEKYPTLQTLKRVDDMSGAKFDMAETREEQIELLTSQLKIAQDSLGVAEAMYQAANTTVLDVHLAKSGVLGIEIQLLKLREAKLHDSAESWEQDGREATKANIRKLKQERVQVLHQAVKVALALYREGALDLRTVRSAQQELLEAGDEPATAGPKAGVVSSQPASAELSPRLFRQSVSDVDAGPVWGEAVGGLQLAVSGIKQGRHFKSEETIRFRLSVRNVGTDVIRFQYNHPKTCDWVAPDIERANGERVTFPIARFRGGHKIFNETLEPNAVVSIQVSGVLVLGASDTAQKNWPRIEKPESGEYRLRAGYLVEPLDANGKHIIQRDAGGTRRAKYSILTSGAVTFHID